MKLSIGFEPRDLWVGFYWKIDQGWGHCEFAVMPEGEILDLPTDTPQGRKLIVFVCLVPAFPIRLEVRWPFRGKSAYARQSDTREGWIIGKNELLIDATRIEEGDTFTIGGKRWWLTQHPVLEAQGYPKQPPLDPETSVKLMGLFGSPGDGDLGIESRRGIAIHRPDPDFQVKSTPDGPPLDIESTPEPKEDVGPACHIDCTHPLGGHADFCPAKAWEEGQGGADEE